MNVRFGNVSHFHFADALTYKYILVELGFNIPRKKEIVFKVNEKYLMLMENEKKYIIEIRNVGKNTTAKIIVRSGFFFTTK